MPDENNPKVVIKTHDDLDTSAGHHYINDHKTGHSYKHGGASHGSKAHGHKDWSQNHKNSGDSGHDKHGDSGHWKKSDHNQDKLGKNSGHWSKHGSDKKGGDYGEWKDKKEWSTDKGSGYEKGYKYDRSHGLKDSHGNKGSHYAKKQHGDDGGHSNLKKHSSHGHHSDNNHKKYGDSDWTQWKKIDGSHGSDGNDHSLWSHKEPTYYITSPEHHGGYEDHDMHGSYGHDLSGHIDDDHGLSGHEAYGYYR